MLRSIRPTRATTSLAASVDPTEARKTTVARVGRLHRSALRLTEGSRPRSAARLSSWAKMPTPQAGESGGR
jgi:hypothetical protein